MIVCTLNETEFEDRGEWMRKLGGSLVSIEADRGAARLRFDADKHDELEEFVRAESRCCGFFDFGLTTENGTTELSIRAPEHAAWAVRGLVAGFVAGWEGFV
jgi:hypothetical protein